MATERKFFGKRSEAIRALKDHNLGNFFSWNLYDMRKTHPRMKKDSRRRFFIGTQLEWLQY